MPLRYSDAVNTLKQVATECCTGSPCIAQRIRSTGATLETGRKRIPVITSQSAGNIPADVSTRPDIVSHRRCGKASFSIFGRAGHRERATQQASRGRLETGENWLVVCIVPDEWPTRRTCTATLIQHATFRSVNLSAQPGNEPTGR